MNESIVFHFKMLRENKKNIIHFLNHLKKSYNSKVCIKQNEFEKEFISVSSENIVLLLFDSIFWIILKDKTYNNQYEEHLKVVDSLPDCLMPVQLTNKKMVQYFFEHDFSNNLLEMFIDGDDEYEYFDKLLIYGEGLNYSSEYKQALKIPEVNFEYIKLQPKNSNSVVTFWNNNHLDVDGNASINDTLSVARSFNRYFQNYLIENEELFT
ncbi:hypothetical protein NSQ90_00505 [Paenibacillus sp. FSL H7-0737]|uniref:hypothetical protein n=1 Tax=Paenibacillus TaxID=44249 RepID=UPI0004F83A4D|nr:MULTISPECIES: hypothetical protein [Paenibacillus]AIQ21482.1 hypothetical protein H70737_00530 [Paenibacillus sp. FSL H7-0737]OMD70442.1 hypothetical protein BSK50_27825 [Paenibacillus odorifer]